MKTHNMTKTLALLCALIVTGCSRSPNQTADSSHPPASQPATNSPGPSPDSPGTTTPPNKEPLMPAASINVVNINLMQFVEMYSSLANADVDTSRLGSPLPTVLIHFTNTNAATRSQLVQLLEQALYDQTGIVATHTDKTNVVLEYRSSANGK